MKKLILSTLFLGLTGITHSAERPKINQWKRLATLPITGIRTLFSSPTSSKEKRVANQVKKNIIGSVMSATLMMIITNALKVTCEAFVSSPNENEADKNQIAHLLAGNVGLLAGMILSYKAGIVIEQEINGESSDSYDRERNDKEQIFSGAYIGTCFPFLAYLLSEPISKITLNGLATISAYKSLLVAGLFTNDSLPKRNRRGNPNLDTTATEYPELFSANNSEDENDDVEQATARGEMFEQ